MAELHPELAKQTAREVLRFTEAEEFRSAWHGSDAPWPHRADLAQALDHAETLAAMVLNLAERVAIKLDETAMIDAAMVEMQGIHPPLRRSDCQRLIRAALSWNAQYESWSNNAQLACSRCRGKGCTDEGDPEIGSALFACEKCGGSGTAAVPAAPLPGVQAVGMAGQLLEARAELPGIADRPVTEDGSPLKLAGAAGLLGDPDVYDDNPDGVKPGQDSPMRQNPNTGAWE